MNVAIGPQTKIGFIGLGLMGRPMGMNLLKAGFPLTVWNRTPARAHELVAAGAYLAASPGELAARSELVISIVSDPPALEEVLWGANGAMQCFPTRQHLYGLEHSVSRPGAQNCGSLRGA